MKLSLTGMPLPPSINNAYLNVAGRGRVKSGEYHTFDRAFTRWAMTCFPKIQAAREQIKSMIGPGKAIHVDHIFYFERSRIIQLHDSKKKTKAINAKKSGEPKTNDTSNRIKIIDDAVANVLQIDDSWFWSGTYNKQILLPGGSESCDLIFTSISIE